MQQLINKAGIHYLFFTDDLGIASIFPALKQRLAEAGHQFVSLFYCSLYNQHSFKKELEILQKRFPVKLIVSYLSEDFASHCVFQQEDMEAILNANTMPQMNFVVSGNEGFVQKVKELLIFLGIQYVQIQEQYFTE